MSYRIKRPEIGLIHHTKDQVSSIITKDYFFHEVKNIIPFLGYVPSMILSLLQTPLLHDKNGFTLLLECGHRICGVKGHKYIFTIDICHSQNGSPHHPQHVFDASNCICSLQNCIKFSL